MKKILALLLVAAISLHAKETTITGKILGADGKPMKLAHATLTEWRGDMEKKISVQADKNGKFSLKTDKTGLYSLQLSGVSHQSCSVEPILIDKPKKISFSARLKAFPHENFSDVQIVTSLDKMDWEKARPMQKNPDGTYSAEFATDEKEISYQLLNVVPQHSVNGTQADRFENDGSGDYLSFVKPAGGKIKIVFDPKKLIPSKDEEKISFDDVYTKKFIGAYEYVNQLRVDFRAAMENQSKSRQAPGFHFDVSGRIAELKNKISMEKDAFNREIYSFELLAVFGYDMTNQYSDAELAKKAISNISPESWVWALEPYYAMKASQLAGEKENSLAEKIVESNPRESVRRELLSILMVSAFNSKNDELGMKYYKRLIAEYPDSWEAKHARNDYDPNRSIQVGKIIPALDISSIDGKEKFTVESLKGKVWLIDFWATWCGPCMMEMAGIHKAYEKFHNRGFEILSLSFDRAAEDVAKMTSKGKYPMPWKHAFVEGGFNSELAKRYEVMGIPKPILIDSEGKIIALENELRGDQLDTTLEKFLPPVMNAQDK